MSGGNSKLRNVFLFLLLGAAAQPAGVYASAIRSCDYTHLPSRSELLGNLCSSKPWSFFSAAPGTCEINREFEPPLLGNISGCRCCCVSETSETTVSIPLPSYLTNVWEFADQGYKLDADSQKLSDDYFYNVYAAEMYNRSISAPIVTKAEWDKNILGNYGFPIDHYNLPVSKNNPNGGLVLYDAGGGKSWGSLNYAVISKPLDFLRQTGPLPLQACAFKIRFQFHLPNDGPRDNAYNDTLDFLVGKDANGKSIWKKIEFGKYLYPAIDSKNKFHGEIELDLNSGAIEGVTGNGTVDADLVAQVKAALLSKGRLEMVARDDFALDSISVTYRLCCPKPKAPPTHEEGNTLPSDQLQSIESLEMAK